jgi:(1->4)-alpha-D-glucan 1-alpha-D-glucosylmutase
VDFAARKAALADVERVLALPTSERQAQIAELVARWPDGRIKMLLTTAGLRLRREWPDVFSTGAYVPLKTESAVSAGLVAFARSLDTRVILTVVPRLVAPIVSEASPIPLGGDAWKTSRVLLPPELSARTFYDALTGAEITPTSTGQESWIFAGQLFEHVPAALMRSSTND